MSVDLSDASGGGVAVLILGGCGFVGRHLVAHLVEKAPAAKIRVVDKVIPAMANLGSLKAAFDNPTVEFKQANLTSQAGIEKAFDGCDFSFVFNLTFDRIDFGQSDEVYQQLVMDVSTRAGMLAAQKGVARYVELSTAQVYEPTDKATAEGGAKLKPWTKQATFKLRAEMTLRDVPNLNLVVLRPAIMYGPGDINGLSPRVICAAAYKHLDEKMRFAWDGKLRTNTVHVRDVAAACWHVCQLKSPEPIYNLGDKSDSSQGTLATTLEAIFGIKTGFVGTIASHAMKAIGLKKVAEEFNDKHMEAWTAMCKAAGIHNTILTPYIDGELLAHNHLAVNGAAIEKTGFQYAYPQLTPETLKEQVAAYIEQGLFPPLR